MPHGTPEARKGFKAAETQMKRLRRCHATHNILEKVSWVTQGIPNVRKGFTGTAKQAEAPDARKGFRGAAKHPSN